MTGTAPANVVDRPCNPFESPGLLPHRAEFPESVPVQPMPWAEDRRTPRETWLAFLLAGLVLLAQGWFLPLLSLALVVALGAGMALTGRDAWRWSGAASRPD